MLARNGISRESGDVPKCNLGTRLTQSLAPDTMRKHLGAVPNAFISEPILPVGGSFDTDGMARGEPGLPQKFRWRKKEFIVAEVLERWKEHGDCRHGSGERYVRKFGCR